jgi:putative transposase
VTAACDAATISRGSFYYQPKGNDDADVKKQLELAMDKRPRRGFPKLFDAIRRDGFMWNHKKVYREYKDNEFQLKHRKKQRIEAAERKPMPVAGRLNEVWSIDFMSDRLSNGRTFRTFNVLDDFNREALTIEVDTSLPSARVICSLEIIGTERGFPKYLRSDNGPEFISYSLRKFCCSHRIRHRRIEPGKPQQNSFIERFNRSYREDILDLYEFRDLRQVRELTSEWLIEYNYDRGHERTRWPKPHRVCPQFSPFHPSADE